MRRIYVLAVAVACASCATTTQIHLQHESKLIDSPEYQEDQSDCRTYANSAAPMQVTTGHGLQRNLDDWAYYFYRCMRNKGWEAVDQDGKPVNPTPRAARGQVQGSDAELRP